jgi:hypothetical protein
MKTASRFFGIGLVLFAVYDLVTYIVLFHNSTCISAFFITCLDVFPMAVILVVPLSFYLVFGVLFITGIFKIQRDQL